MAVDPSFAVTGPEWRLEGLRGPEWNTDPARDATQAGQAGGTGFGAMLSDQISNLERLQTNAAEASRALATGTATDVSSVVLALERARLSMQLASQVRTRAVEAYQEIFRTQV